MFNIKNKFFFLSIVIAILLWFIETFMHVVVFDIGSFKDEIFPIYDAHEFIMRVTITIVALFAGILSQKMANKLILANKKEKQLNELLEKSIKEIKVLKEVIPICASCKTIRDDEGYWNNIEKYISEHSDTKFTHGICPECAAKLYPEISNTSQSEKKGDRSINYRRIKN